MESVPVRATQGATSNGNYKKPKKLGGRKALIGLIILAVLVVAALGISFAYKMSTGANIDGGKYQAVFFTNGQVYFGKLRSLNGGYMKMTDIYYLQAKADSSAKSDNPQQTTNQANSDVQLIKLGNEVHGPVDEMIISKDQVLFFENLKEQGKVTQSIKKYQADNKKQ